MWPFSNLGFWNTLFLNRNFLNVCIFVPSIVSWQETGRFATIRSCHRRDVKTRLLWLRFWTAKPISERSKTFLAAPSVRSGKLHVSVTTLQTFKPSKLGTHILTVPFSFLPSISLQSEKSHDRIFESLRFYQKDSKNYMKIRLCQQNLWILGNNPINS